MMNNIISTKRYDQATLIKGIAIGFFIIGFMFPMGAYLVAANYQLEMSHMFVLGVLSVVVWLLIPVILWLVGKQLEKQAKE
ncbi:hypothetical protein ACFL1M_00780 [Patescibacteria group bacterium]